MVYLLAVATWTFLIGGLMEVFPGNLSKFVQNRIRSLNSQVTPGDTLTRLALRFRDKSDEDSLVLTPPSLTKFRFYSQRSVVYTFYSSPYTDRGYREWANRLEAILGTIRPPLSHRNIDTLYRNRNAAELVKVAKQFGADYILTRSDWHSNINGMVVDAEGKWILYKIASSTR